MSNNTFRAYNTAWLDEFRRLIHHLSTTTKPPSTAGPTAADALRRQLVDQTMSHIETYYLTKSTAAAAGDVLNYFAAPWATALERSLHWIGGWRPTTAFHLVYTESSILFESQVVDLLRGIRTGDLGDLSPEQFRRVSELQCETVHQENCITDELSDWQDGAIDLVGMYCDLDSKMRPLVGILERADQLRLKTIEKLVELLTPQQAAEFLVAAAELHFGIKCWGIEQDHQRGTNTITMNGS